mmetsp:Transcript_22642/g.33759  ORF Transcript_22642/g.33759 Transcript_22642/m.33759 type:complete len:1671 (+) Transcript_22642:64-5076(+)
MSTAMSDLTESLLILQNETPSLFEDTKFKTSRSRSSSKKETSKSRSSNQESKSISQGEHFNSSWTCTVTRPREQKDFKPSVPMVDDNAPTLSIANPKAISPSQSSESTPEPSPKLTTPPLVRPHNFPCFCCKNRGHLNHSPNCAWSKYLSDLKTKTARDLQFTRQKKPNYLVRVRCWLCNDLVTVRRKKGGRISTGFDTFQRHIKGNQHIKKYGRMNWSEEMKQYFFDTVMCALTTCELIKPFRGERNVFEVKDEKKCVAIEVRLPPSSLEGSVSSDTNRNRSSSVFHYDTKRIGSNHYIKEAQMTNLRPISSAFGIPASFSSGRINVVFHIPVVPIYIKPQDYQNYEDLEKTVVNFREKLKRGILEKINEVKTRVSSAQLPSGKVEISFPNCNLESTQLSVQWRNINARIQDGRRMKTETGYALPSSNNKRRHCQSMVHLSDTASIESTGSSGSDRFVGQARLCWILSFRFTNYSYTVNDGQGRGITNYIDIDNLSRYTTNILDIVGIPWVKRDAKEGSIIISFITSTPAIGVLVSKLVAIRREFKTLFDSKEILSFPQIAATCIYPNSKKGRKGDETPQIPVPVSLKASVKLQAPLALEIVRDCLKFRREIPGFGNSRVFSAINMENWNSSCISQILEEASRSNTTLREILRNLSIGLKGSMDTYELVIEFWGFHVNLSRTESIRNHHLFPQNKPRALSDSRLERTSRNSGTMKAYQSENETLRRNMCDLERRIKDKDKRINAMIGREKEMMSRILYLQRALTHVSNSSSDLPPIPPPIEYEQDKGTEANGSNSNSPLQSTTALRNSRRRLPPWHRVPSIAKPSVVPRGPRRSLGSISEDYTEHISRTRRISQGSPGSFNPENTQNDEESEPAGSIQPLESPDLEKRKSVSFANNSSPENISSKHSSNRYNASSLTESMVSRMATTSTFSGGDSAETDAVILAGLESFKEHDSESPKDSKGTSKLKELRREFINSEKKFVGILSKIMNAYIIPLRSVRKSGKPPLLSSKHMKIVFGNVELLHSSIYKFLKEAEATEESVGTIIQSQDAYFEHIKTYIENYEETVESLHQLSRDYRTYSGFLKYKATKEAEMKDTLSYLLEFPLNQISQCSQILKKLRSHTSNASHSQDLDKALGYIDPLQLKASEILTRVKHMRELYDLEKKFVTGTILATKNQKLVKAGICLKSFREGGMRKRPYHFFLFSNLFLYADRAKFSKKLKIHWKADINSSFEIEDKRNLASGRHRYSLKIHTPKKTFLLNFSSLQEKQEWYVAIKGVMKACEKKKRGSRRLSSSSNEKIKPPISSASSLSSLSSFEFESRLIACKDDIIQLFDVHSRLVRARKIIEDKLHGPPSHSAVVVSSFDAQNAGELSLVEGQTVNLLSKNAPRTASGSQWWFGEIDRSKGMFPRSCVKKYKRCWFRVIEAFNPGNAGIATDASDFMHIKKKDIIRVLKMIDGGWWYGLNIRTNDTGWIPTAFLEECDQNLTLSDIEYQKWEGKDISRTLSKQPKVQQVKLTIVGTSKGVCSTCEYSGKNHQRLSIGSVDSKDSTSDLSVQGSIDSALTGTTKSTMNLSVRYGSCGTSRRSSAVTKSGQKQNKASDTRRKPSTSQTLGTTSWLDEGSREGLHCVPNLPRTPPRHPPPKHSLENKGRFLRPLQHLMQSLFGGSYAEC